MRSERSLVALLTVVLVVGLLPAASQAESLEEARAERQRIQTRLDEAATRLGDVETRVAELEREHDQLRERVEAQQADLEEVDERLAVRVREVYKHGTAVDPIAVFLASDDPADALDRAGAVQRLVHGDQAESEEIAAARTRLMADVERLEERREQLDAAVEEQRRVTASLTSDLERAEALEQRLEREDRERRERERRERERREAERQAAREQQAREQRTAAPAPSTSSSGMVCPVDQPRSFTDTWGAARSGGRQHRGTDILAPRGTPIRAITSGVWDIRPYGANAGHWAILRGDDGNQYWYMHLDSHTVGNGARVSAGQQTGTNGDTGNARGTPHLHFELHPGGGSAVNPYSLLRRVCG